MLENLKTQEAIRLRKKEGRKFKKLSIPDLKKGTLIRATTYSGNTYFFEVVDPQGCVAHVFRCDVRSSTPKTGYRGQRKVYCDMRVGAPIYHGDSQTSSVSILAIVDY